MISGLIFAGIATEVDLFRLKRYCTWAELFELAEEKIKDQGAVLSSLKGGAYPNPWVNIMSMAEKAMDGTETEFGMTPASRSKVKAANPKQQDLFGDYVRDAAADAASGDAALN